MMSTKQILVVSDPTINDNTLLLLRDLSKTYETTFVNTDERAIEIANRQHFDLAVVDSSSADIDFKKLAAVLPILCSEIELVRYEGGALTGLENRVRAVFTKKRNERIRRFLVLDSSAPGAWNDLPAFSAN
jgi:hypothetical protein